MREQRQAERALSARLAAEDKARRAALRQALKQQHPAGSLSAVFVSAGREATGRAGGHGPQRPRERSQGGQGRVLRR